MTPSKSTSTPITPFSPLSLARMLWKSKFLIPVITLAGTAIGYVMIHYLPNVYKSEATILVEAQRIPEKYVTSTVNTQVQDRLMTIRQQVLSTTQLMKLIDAFGLYKDERKRLAQEEIIEKMQKDIGIELVRGWIGDRPGAFKVSFQGSNPTLITEVANRLASDFMDENLKTREKEAEGTSDFIDSQLVEAKKILDDLESRVSQYKLQHNGELPEQENALAGTLSRLQIQLQGAQDAVTADQQNRQVTETQLTSVQATEAALTQALTPRTSSASGASGPPVVQPSRKRSDALQAEYDARLVRYKATYPEQLTLHDEIVAMRKTEDQEAADATAELAKTWESRVADAKASGQPMVTTPDPAAQQQLRNAHEQVVRLQLQLSFLDAEIKKKTAEREQVLKAMNVDQARLEQLPVREQEMAGLLRDYDTAKSQYKSLLEKKNAAGMAANMETRQEAEKFTTL